MKILMNDMKGLKNIDMFNAGDNWIADGVSTDTRKKLKGRLFFALKGEKFDGHDFVKDAFKGGAAGIVINRSRKDIINRFNTNTIFDVEDTFSSLEELAGSIRHRHDPVVIGITGSNGKTTTKEMVAALLSAKKNVGKTEGNFNNLIGLPISILNMENDTNVWVLELGTSRFGELASLTNIADPDIGILTNIGRSHLEFFGDIEGVAKAKAEMFENMSVDSTAIVNSDDPFIKDIARRFRGDTLSAGFAEDAELRIVSFKFVNEGMEFDILHNNEQQHMYTPLNGRHYLYDIGYAILCARVLGIEWDAIKDACMHFYPVAGRGKTINYNNGITVIDDTYNANPDSVSMGLLSAVEKYGPDSIMAVIGDMLELGKHAPEQHIELGEFMALKGVRKFILTGEFSEYVKKGIVSTANDADVRQARDIDQVVNELATMIRSSAVIYIKGSRKMHMEDILTELERVKGWSHD